MSNALHSKVRDIVQDAGYKYAKVYIESSEVTMLSRLKFVHGHTPLTEEFKNNIDTQVHTMLNMRNIDYERAEWQVNSKGDGFYEYEFYAVYVPWNPMRIPDYKRKYR